MKYLTYLFILIAFNNGLFAQISTFSKLFISGEIGDWEKGCNVIALEDSTYIVADNHLERSDGENYLNLFKVNTQGDFLWEKRHSMPTGGGHLACFGRFFQTQDDGFAFASFRRKGGLRNAYLVKFDKDGEVLWDEDYGRNDVGETVRTGMQTKNGDYILTGYSYHEFDSTVVYVVRTDSIGNKLWEKYIDTEKDHGEAINVTESPEGYILIGGLTADSHNWGDDFMYREDGLVIVLDSMGNELYRRFFEAPNEQDDCPTHVQSLPQGGFFIWGCERIESIAVANSYFIAKLDDNYEIIWQTFLDDGVIPNGAGKKKIYKVIALENGGFLAVGGHAPNWNTVSMWAWVGRFSKEGTLLWDKTYDYFAEGFFPVTDTDNEFFDTTETLDGGFFLTGRQETIYVYESGGAVGTDNIWIMKVDSMGCLEAGCEGDFFVLNDIDVGIEGVEELKGELRIVPNPSKGMANLYWTPQEGISAELKIFDLTGRQIANYAVDAATGHTQLSIEGLKNGIYICTLNIGEEITYQTKWVIVD